MSFAITRLKAQLTGEGARPTLFQVQLNNPVFPAANFKIPFMVKAASLPSSTVGKIEVPWMGRKIPYGGDRTFEDWTVTVINDEDFAVRNAMEAWSNAINSHVSNTRSLSGSYKTDGTVTQYGKAGQPIRVVTFHGMFPINVAPIELAWADSDTIEEFQVTFAFDEWTISGGGTGISTT